MAMKIGDYFIKGLAALVWLIAQMIALMERILKIGKRQQVEMQANHRAALINEDGQEYTVTRI